MALVHHNWQLPISHMPGLHENGLSIFEKEKGIVLLQTSLVYILYFLCKVECDIDKFIHAPTTRTMRSCDYLCRLPLLSAIINVRVVFTQLY